MFLFDRSVPAGSGRFIRVLTGTGLLILYHESVNGDRAGPY